MAEPGAAPAPNDPDPTEAATLALLRTLAASADDAFSVTDMDARILVWNAAAERLYGIAAGDALGQVIFALTDAAVVGEGHIPIRLPREIALTSGAWHGRVIERPTTGDAVGREVVVETSLSRLVAPDGTARGVLNIKRDITASYRLEQELAALGSLATATGGARSRAEIAQAAIDVLCLASAARFGVIVWFEPDDVTVDAAHQMDDEMLRRVVDLAASDTPVHDAIRTPGSLLLGDVDDIAMNADAREWLAAVGLATIAVVGLHRGEDLVGALALGWADPDAPRLSSAVLLQAGAHVERALENARLVEEITVRADAERALIRRLDVLDELTRIGQAVRTADELAERSARLVGEALEASGTAYGLLDRDGSGYATASVVGVARPIADWLASNPPGEHSAFRRWRAGEGSILERFEAGIVTAATLEVARAAGVTAYAAIPIRVEGELVGGIVAYFEGAPDALHVNHATLDSVARIVGISLANFRYRERFERSEARYRTLFEASPDAYLLCDLDGTIIEANGAANELYGASLVGVSVGDFLDLDPDEARRLREAVDRGEQRRYSGTARRADGSHVPRESEASRVRIEDDERYLVVVRDLTERQRLQTELVQAQKMETVGILVSGVAHELNNPIASIIGLSTIIGRDPGLSTDLRESAALLVGEAQRAGQIVRTFLDFVRSRPPERHPTPLGPLLETVRELQSYSQKSGVEWVIDVEPELPRVAIDRSQIQQVMINLTTNAIQAILADRPAGRLEVTARRGPSGDGRPTVRITVTDDGPGVATFDRSKLFVPFFSTKEPGQGTGLGLSVSFDIVRRHDGTLTYEPAPGGRGARFIVELPVEAPSSARARPSPSRTRPARQARRGPAGTRDRTATGGVADARRPRALILDDEESIRTFLRKALTAAGFEAVVAADGQAAVSAVRAGPIDVALVDHRMPGMSGIEAFEKAVAARPELAGRWLFMSGDVLNPDLQAFAEARGLPLLAKPFDLATVNRAVGEIVERLGLAD
ncbi:MAG: PAS domain S-box protein [Candidatus Limnocylindrales bacterium]